MLQAQEVSRRRVRINNGPIHRVQHVSPEVEEFIRLVKADKPPYLIGQWLSQWLNRKLDSELELLASTTLSMDLDDILKDPAALGCLYRGNYQPGLQHLASRMRRRFAKLLRDHQRSDKDLFIDNCEVE